MPSANDVCTLVIKNIDILNQSYKIYTDIVEPHFFSCLDETVKKGIEKQLGSDWEHNCNFKSDKLRFWRTTWSTKGQRQNIKGAYFDLKIINDPGIDWLCIFTGILNGKIGIYFEINSDVWKISKDMAKQKKQEFFKKNIDILTQYQFTYHDGEIYIPFKLELEAIARDYPDLGEKTFAPLMQVLNAIKETERIFNNFVKELSNKKLRAFSQ